MKKYILMPVLAALSLSGSVAQAQDFDNKPVVNAVSYTHLTLPTT